MNQAKSPLFWASLVQGVFWVVVLVVGTLFPSPTRNLFDRILSGVLACLAIYAGIRNFRKLGDPDEDPTVGFMLISGFQVLLGGAAVACSFSSRQDPALGSFVWLLLVSMFLVGLVTLGLVIYDSRLHK